MKTTSVPEAKRKLRDFRAELERTDPDQHHRTLEDVARSWLAMQSHLAPATLKRKKTIVQRLLDDIPNGACRKMSTVTNEQVRQWLASYDHGPTATHHYLETVRSIFKHAISNRIIAYDPTQDIERPRRIKPRRNAPTYQQFLAIVESARAQTANGHGAEETAATLAIMGEQGLGQAEVAGIERRHVDLETGLLQLYRVKTRTEFTVPIMPKARPIIERRMELTLGMPPTTRLFPTKNPRAALANACTRLGFPRFTCRALRRMFVTRALRAGVDVRTIAAWQGHTDGGTLILQVYSDVIDETHGLEQAGKMA